MLYCAVYLYIRTILYILHYHIRIYRFHNYVSKDAEKRKRIRWVLSVNIKFFFYTVKNLLVIELSKTTPGLGTSESVQHEKFIPQVNTDGLDGFSSE